MRYLNKFLFEDESGQALSEYGVIIAVVVVAAIAALGILAAAVNGVFTNAAAELPDGTTS